MAKHTHKDFHKNELQLDDEVIIVDRTDGQFIQGKITEFRHYAVGIQPNTFRGGICTYWRTGKEVVKCVQ